MDEAGFVGAGSGAGPGKRWWGRYEVPLQGIGRYRVGPLTVWIQRQPTEWRIAYERTEDPLESTLDIEPTTSDIDLLSKGTVARFGLSDDRSTVELWPALADRPVIARPEMPFHLPAGEKATVYVSSPIWVQVRLVGKGLLLELPSFRPSDTWFGPTTHGGELCYASKAFFRMNLDKMPIRPHRAVTAVELRNRARTSLRIDRLRLPVTQLALYQTTDGRLFTQDAVLERESEGDFASLDVLGGAPAIDRFGTLVSEARSTVLNRVVRAFASFLS